LQITVRDALTTLHGMLFGALLLLMFTGAAAALYASSTSSNYWTPTSRQRRCFSIYLSIMALLAWAAVLLGAYAIYPWYRAIPPAGTLNLDGYPQRLLMSNPATAGWHDIGMEWKEHIAWFAPISLTAVAYTFAHYGTDLRAHRPLRNAVFALLALGFIAAGVAGFFGAMLNKYAPVRGGTNIVLLQGETHER
jgi:hypothetical protein